MQQLENILFMTFDEMNKLYQIAEETAIKAGDWYPSLEDLNNIVKNDPVTYIDFLIWIYETAIFPSNAEAQNIKVLINKIIKETIQLID